MNIGMLWFDNDSKADVKAKVKRAADYYHQKYGLAPNICYVHPSMIAEDRQRAGMIEVRRNESVLPNHFWIGVNGSGSSNGK